MSNNIISKYTFVCIVLWRQQRILEAFTVITPHCDYSLACSQVS